MFRKISRLNLLLVTMLFATLFATAACQPVQPVSAMKASAATIARDKNQAVAQSFYDAVNEKQFDRLKDIFAADMVDHEVGFGPAVKDTELFAAFPDQQVKVDQWVIEGDLVTALVTVSGTSQAALQGAGPTGKPVTWSQIDIWHIKDGRIAEVWHNFPTADILQQVGYQLIAPSK